MKNNLKLLLLLVFASNIMFAQNDTLGWGRNSRFNRMYDLQTVTEIKGQVTRIEEIAPMRGASPGIHLTLKSGSENITVHLGPKWYLDKQALKFNVKDRVMVKGSKVNFEGVPTIIAAEITKGKTVLKLRNENGVPVWSGRGRR